MHRGLRCLLVVRFVLPLLVVARKTVVFLAILSPFSDKLITDDARTRIHSEACGAKFFQRFGYKLVVASNAI